MKDIQTKQKSFFNEFVGSKLREAREARGFTATFLANQIGVTRASISNYENGKRTPTENIFDAICNVLGFPGDYFIDNSIKDFELDSPIFYRSMSAATKRARVKAETKFGWFVSFMKFLEAFVILPPVNFPEIDLPRDPVKMSNCILEDAAEQVRRFWGLGTGPISNFVWLLENNGAVVVRCSLEADELDAFSGWIDGRPFVVLNSDKNSAARSRFDAAHELGHLVLHKDLPREILHNPEYFSLIEKQAHRFAAAILFPEPSFSKEVPTINLELFRILKRRWKVSIKMMLKRADDLDFLNEKTSQNLYRSYARKGWSRIEPFEDEIPVEIPKLVFNSVELVLKEKVWLREEILRAVRLNHQDLEDCSGLPRNFLNPQAGEIRQISSRLRRDSVQTELKEAGRVIKFPAPAG